MANIISFLNKIRTAMYGKDVRGSIYGAIDAINTETESSTKLSKDTQHKQTTLEKKYDDQIANMTNENPSISELVDYRTSGITGETFVTAGKRADAVDAKLADTMNFLTELTVSITNKKFGANSSLSDNTKAIQTAIDYVKARGGGKVFVPAETFYVKGKAQTICLWSKVSLFGNGKESVIKIHASTGDWGSLFYTPQEAMADIEISNLTLDCNEDNIVTKTEQWGTTNRVLLNLGEGYRYKIHDVNFVTNGVWGIRAKARDSEFYNLRFQFTSKNLPSSFDVSTLWCGGSNNDFYKNTINVIDSSVFRPATAMEIQGHYNFIHTNRVFNYYAGLIFTNSTSYENKWDVIETLGAIKTQVFNNIFSVKHTGIDLWGMYKEGGNGTFYKVSIHDNDIRIDNVEEFGKSSRCGIKTHMANQFSDNPVDRKQNCNFDGLEIYDNRIEFALRKPFRTIYNSDTGIKLENIVSMNNTMIRDNTIKNCGGHGIYWSSSLLLMQDVNGNWIEDPRSNDNFHQFSLIDRNTFDECLIPIRFGRNVRDVTITNNIFRQKSFYENYMDNMMETIVVHSTTYPENVRFRIKGNSIETVSSLKPFYPLFKSNAANVLAFDKNSVLDDLPKMQHEYPNVKYQIVPHTYYLKLMNGNIVTPSSTVWATRGDLKTFVNGDVKIKSIIDTNVLVVNDSTNIYPLQTLLLDSNFNSTYAIVLAVVGNYVICINNVALKDGVSSGYLDTFVLKYFNNLVTVVEGGK
ncbi:hypothetical protein GH890_10115 [Bacillus thuringiensis]|nr:hypothetical protein [Bacillus thuringiensis]